MEAAAILDGLVVLARLLCGAGIVWGAWLSLRVAVSPTPLEQPPVPRAEARRRGAARAAGSMVSHA